MSETTRTLAGILLLSLVTVETGGVYLVQLVRGTAPATPFQLAFARAGHAHAGVLLIVSLTGLLYADSVHLTGLWGWLARIGAPAAALMMPAGFFFSSMGAGRNTPNAFIALVYAGGLTLAAGLTSLGIGLLVA
ncbi:hypothetical protein [Mycobacterium sp. M23085]|uniref:hypothetical protein n=1 Tax=Mycobacterium sp. M23085 TaxID=3378087 RepID=UPI003877FEBB